VPRWQRVLYWQFRLWSPAALVVALAAFVQGWVTAGLVLVALAATLYGFGLRGGRHWLTPD
jgi:hypothetical protein